MFVHPATTHVSRTYHPPTTTRKKLAVHNENDQTRGLPTKTPSRAGPSGAGAKQLAAGPGTTARIGLGAKTEGRDRNALGRQGGGDGKGKGKEEEIEPKRLFTSSSALPPSRSLSNLPAITSRQGPAPTKTPARTRKPAPNTLRTPAPSTFKIAPDPTSTPLPSATRRRRSRVSGGTAGPGATPVRPTTNQFQTPLPSAQQWEEENSLEEVQEVQEGIELDVLGEVEEESEPDIEYMPPRAVELPFQPEWGEDADIPNLVRRLQGVPPVMFSGGMTEIPQFEMEEEPVKLVLASEEDLEDPLFRRLPASLPQAESAKQAVNQVPGPQRTTVPTRTINARPTTGTAQVPRTTLKPGTNPITRPSTSTIARKPIITNPTAKSTATARPPTMPTKPTARRPVLSARPANPNLPIKKPVLNGMGKEGKVVVEEDEGMRLAALELGGVEVDLSLDFE